MDRCASVLRNLDSRQHRHRRWNLYSLGSESYQRSGAGKGFDGFFDHVCAAAVDDGLLLLENCLCAEKQGKYHKESMTVQVTIVAL